MLVKQMEDVLAYHGEDHLNFPARLHRPARSGGGMLHRDFPLDCSAILVAVSGPRATSISSVNQSVNLRDRQSHGDEISVSGSFVDSEKCRAPIGSGTVAGLAMLWCSD